MAQAAHLPPGAASKTPPENVSRTPVLLAACKATVCQLRNQQWQVMFDSKAFRLQLLRNGPGNFVLLVVDEQALKIQEKIVLRFNTVFKVINKTFFSLLDNGVTIWGFEVIGMQADGQTFSVVMQNSLASLKDNICLTLSDAINRGNEQFASDLARQLASQKALVSIKLDEPEKDKLSKLTESNTIIVKVQVEDKEAAGTQFMLDVRPQTTIQQLKQMVQMKYQFPMNVQRWIIGKRLPKATESLADCGIKKSGSILFLYLISDKTPPEQRNETPTVHRTHSDSELAASAQSQRDVPRDAFPNVFGMAQNVMQSMPQMPIARVRAQAPPPPVGWRCQLCTYVNAPTRPGCEMCASDRPADYQVPEHYLPDERERERIERERNEVFLLEQEEEMNRRRQIEERDRNFQRLLSVVDQRLVENQEEFDCPICFVDYGVGEGVVLRECLHTFCRDCLTEHIRNTVEPEVQCPFDNGDFACHDVITPQEIQELLTEEDFQKYLERSLTTAESQAANSFHCQTPNCHGWCIYDDEVNDFDCPVCGKRNCLTCKAIHHPINCKEYQDDLKRNANNDEAARKTQQYLEQMLKTKDGMRCPGCQIVLVKKDGCDWMKCTMCKTEICWAVRGPRWGPGGAGDTSGGCKCRTNGNAKCHPQCRNCH